MLELSVSDGDSCPVITLSGQADLTAAARLDQLITAQLSRGSVRLVVDATELSFADSMALRALILAALTLKDRGGGMVLLRPQPPVARILALAGADQVITIDGTPETTPVPQEGTDLPGELGPGWALAGDG
jgi:anti-anti-sigma factor